MLASHFSDARVIGIGETLWDLFPDGAVWGGAPANVACHAACLGGVAVMVSRVGQDDLGDRGVATLESLGVDCRHVQRDGLHLTGTVSVSLGPAGDASYEFAADAAWDHLAWDPGLGPLAAGAAAVCFGTLGQRAATSRTTIRRFLQEARGALRLFDVNLRQHFHSPEVIRESLALANALKLNDEELPTVAAACGIDAADPPRAVVLVGVQARARDGHAVARIHHALAAHRAGAARSALGRLAHVPSDAGHGTAIKRRRARRTST